MTGSFNHLIVVLGQPGTGKSTYALRRAKAIGHDTPAYVLAHDPGWRLPDDPSLRRYQTFAEASIGLMQEPGAIHSLSVPDGESVVEWARTCAKASKGIPFLVLLDEGVGASGLNPYRLSPAMRNFVATRRHDNVGMIVTLQSPALGHYQLLGLSTELVMFRLIDERGLRRLQSIGVPEATVHEVRSLPNYSSITHRTG